VQAIARRGDGRVINVSPLWTLQCLSSGPDQMLRQPTLTAKRTMTRAGDVNDGLDRGAAIRERSPRDKGLHRCQTINRLQLSIRPLMQLLLLASMRSADRRPITLAGI
jgi:hypothetical protein